MGGYIGWRVINIEFGHNWRKNLIGENFILKVQLKETWPTMHDVHSKLATDLSVSSINSIQSLIEAKAALLIKA